MQIHSLDTLIIFDCDGVLVDSEPISNRIFNQMLADLGAPMTVEETMVKYMGRSMKACYAMIYDEYGIRVTEEFSEQYQQRISNAFVKELKAVNYITEALDTISHATCVASSGRHEKMRVTLGITGLFPHFEGRIFSATEVENGKPAPDLFLHAASKMGFAPERCIVVEDSAPGIQAARAAGMTALGYTERTPALLLAHHGAHTFSTMKELPPLINTIIQSWN